MKRLIMFLACLILAVMGGVYFISLRGARMEKQARLNTIPKPAKPVARNVQLIPGPVIHPEHSEATSPQPKPSDKKEAPGSSATAELPEPASSKSTAKAATAQGGKAKLQDPIARAALSEVGFSPEAEEYWLAAINDPTLSDHEREDLIEDLNEEGFDDPKNLTEDDLPLIMRRIEIIETYAPEAMDDVNAAAFIEAYRDLINMFAKVAGL